MLLSVVLFASCSQDETESTKNENATALSVLDGNLLSFKTEKDFLEEYENLSELNSRKKIQDWVSKKGHESLINIENDSLANDSLVAKNTIIYSDAIKSILNRESKVKINNKVIWLDGNNFFELSKSDISKNSKTLKSERKNLKVFGEFLNGYKKNDSSSSRFDIPSTNGTTRSFSNNGPNGKRYYTTFYIETIVLPLTGELGTRSTTKVFLNTSMSYRSCSFWRCTYKNDNSVRTISLNLTYLGCGFNFICLSVSTPKFRIFISKTTLL